MGVSAAHHTHLLPKGHRVAGKYEIVSTLGTGGMGAVYAAYEELEEREVALKVFHPELAGSSQSAKQWEKTVARLKQEVRALKALRDPRIVQVLDWGIDGTTLYLAMERLKGRTLADRLDDDGFPTMREGARLVSELLSGLVAVHSNGIVHRDLKPENIFLERSPEGGESLKIIDFGLVRLPESKLTQVGQWFGTYGYMSPEQRMSSRGVTFAADVYSVGVMLYELLAGERPFQAVEGEGPDDALALGNAMLARDCLPLHERVPGIPARLAALVWECLAPKPDERPQDASALRSRLLEILENEHLPETYPPAPPARPQSSKPASIIAPPRTLHVAVDVDVEESEPPPRLAEASTEEPPRKGRYVLHAAIAAAALASVGVLAVYLTVDLSEPDEGSALTVVAPSGDEPVGVDESVGDDPSDPVVAAPAADDPAPAPTDVGAPEPAVDPPEPADPPAVEPAASSSEVKVTRPASSRGGKQASAARRGDSEAERARGSAAARTAREYLEFGSVSQAIRALELHGVGPSDAIFLIQLYERNGDTARARTAKEQFIQRYPRHRRSGQYRRELGGS